MTRSNTGELACARPRCRPFKLADAMILIGVAAMWMALMRTSWDQFQMVFPTGMALPWQLYAARVHTGLTMGLISLIAAYIWLRLKPPRLSMADMLRQPGMLFIALLIAIALLHGLVSLFVPLDDRTDMIVALALGVSWLAICRRYRQRAESGWIEGIGRTFGVGVIVSLATNYSVYLRVLL